MLRSYYFHIVLSKEAYADAFRSLQSANAKEPDQPMILAMLADLHFVSHALDLGIMEDPLEKGASLIERAAALEPSNQFVIAILATLHFHRNERTAFFSCMERALKLHPKSGLRGGGIGFYLCLYGDWERGMALLQKAMRLSPNFPDWFYGPIVLWHYRKRDYDSAYREALKYSMPNNFWGPMLRAATLGLLGRDADADRSALLELLPDFSARADRLIRLYVKEEKLVEQLLEGLRRAGLDVGE
jgi:adenylate cyclase